MVKTRFYLTPKQISEILGVHKQSIYNRIYNGSLEAIKILGNKYVEASQLLQLTDVELKYIVQWSDNEGIYLQDLILKKYLKFYPMGTDQRVINEYIELVNHEVIEVKVVNTEGGCIKC